MYLGKIKLETKRQMRRLETDQGRYDKEMEYIPYSTEVQMLVLHTKLEISSEE